MAKSRCSKGKHMHKKTGQCRTPCKKSHGKGFRRSPKAPYYKCIKQKPSKKKSGKSKAPKTPKARKSSRSTKGIAAKRLSY